MKNRNDPFRLVRYVALGAAEGVVAGWILLLILIKANILGLDDLLDGTADGPLALLMLLWVFGTSFGMVGIVWRVMVLLPGEKD